MPGQLATQRIVVRLTGDELAAVTAWAAGRRLADAARDALFAQMTTPAADGCGV